MIAAVTFLGDTDAIAFRPFREPDFEEFDIAADRSEDGVQAKEFVRDTDGAAWLVKSGAHVGKHPTDLSDEEERSRRAAFSVNEALVPLLYGTCGLLINEVRLGFRTMHVREPEEHTTQLVSLHRMQHGVRGDKAEGRGIKRDEGFYESLLTMLCVDVVVGQIDHKLNHNYLLTHDGRLLPNDNGACMRGAWLVEERVVDDFERLKSVELNINWTEQRRAAVKARLQALTARAIDAAFAALPRQAVNWHDERVEHGYYAAGPISEKRSRMKTNLEVLREWAGL
jgi:hypothetical protein